MAVTVEEIAVGKCFVTSANQVRRVKDIKDGKVQYESRGKKAGDWNNWVWVAIDNFASAVDHEVSCDYDPDFSN